MSYVYAAWECIWLSEALVRIPQGRLRLRHASVLMLKMAAGTVVTDEICELQLWSDRTISEDGPRISGSQSPLTGVSHTLTSSRPTTNDKRVTTIESGFRGLTTRQHGSSSVAENTNASAGHNSVSAVDPPLTPAAFGCRWTNRVVVRSAPSLGVAIPWSKSEPGIATDVSPDVERVYILYRILFTFL